jgi:hypothetical protein
MAKKQQTIVTCDLHDGNETDGVTTIAFGLDGTSYEVDACPEHADQLREAFATYVGAARKAERGAGPTGRRAPRSSTPRSSSGAGSDREQVQAIREWARANGHTVSERGRLSAAVLEAYRAAN